jgi:hypothetical protein
MPNWMTSWMSGMSAPYIRLFNTLQAHAVKDCTYHSGCFGRDQNSDLAFSKIPHYFLLVTSRPMGMQEANCIPQLFVAVCLQFLGQILCQLYCIHKNDGLLMILGVLDTEIEVCLDGTSVVATFDPMDGGINVGSIVAEIEMEAFLGVN